jgi:hypothetical protein
MAERFPRQPERPQIGLKGVVKIIVGLVVLNLLFVLFRAGATWFNGGQPLP